MGMEMDFMRGSMMAMRVLTLYAIYSMQILPLFMLILMHGACLLMVDTNG